MKKLVWLFLFLFTTPLNAFITGDCIINIGEQPKYGMFGTKATSVGIEDLDYSQLVINDGLQHASGNAIGGDVATPNGLGYGFQFTADKNNISKVWSRFRKGGTASTGTLYAKIYLASDDSLLGTSNSQDVSLLGTVDWTDETFTFSPQITTTIGLSYKIMFYFPEGYFNIYPVSYVEFQVDSSSAHGFGGVWQHYNGSIAQLSASWSIEFRTYYLHQ